ncbi:MAG: YaiI/YqxD family protein, partial [Candidatus Latescibacterota bacterium]
MKIWLDADGCPNDVKDCVFKASTRTETAVILVADRWVKLPPHPHLQMIVVNSGFNAADDYIADNAVPGDLVVTDDIPLAHRCVSKEVTTLSRRGQEFNSANIGERLATRDLMEGLRNSGMITGGPAAYSANDKKKFAETFDRLLTQLKKRAKVFAVFFAIGSLFSEQQVSADSSFKLSTVLTD